MSLSSIDFAQLPQRSQERVKRRLAAPGTDTVVFAAGGKKGKVFGLVVASVLAIAAFSMASDAYTDLSMKVAAAVGAVVIGGWSLAAWVARSREGVPPTGYFTRLHLVRINRGHVRYRPWPGRITKVDARRSSDGTVSAILLAFGEKDVEDIWVGSGARAQEILKFLSESETAVVGAASKGEIDALREMDDFLDIPSERHPEPPHWIRTSLGAQTGVMAAALIGLSTVGLQRSHDLAVDRAAWDSATYAASASEYRRYLAERPAGRWREQADDSIGALYDRAAAAYSAALVRGYDKEAVAAITDLLQYARLSGVYRVPVVFHGESRLRDFGGAPTQPYEGYTLHNFGDAFSDEGLRERESNVLSAMQGALSSVVPGDVLSFVSAETSDTAVVTVDYAVNETGAIYVETTRSSETLISRETGRAFRGVGFAWRCTIQSPTSARRYALQLTSEPSVNINTGSGSGGSTPVSAVYTYMAFSAFSDFQSNLARRLGLRLGDVEQR